jgi:dihydrofolate reductase
VILDLSVSLDGFAAGRSVELDNPLGDGGDRLHDWMFARATDVGRRIEREVFAGAGAIVMGRRTFDVGKPHWDPDPKTFRRLPVFVLTHRPQDPIADPGGSTFTFVTGGVEDALEQAQAAAGNRDVVLGGGPSIGRQFLQAGLLDELRIHLVHLLLGAGERLFDLHRREVVDLQATRLVEDVGVTHFRFAPVATAARR